MTPDGYFRDKPLRARALPSVENNHPLLPSVSVSLLRPHWFVLHRDSHVRESGLPLVEARRLQQDVLSSIRTPPYST
jgi:hypothetical protein